MKRWMILVEMAGACALLASSSARSDEPDYEAEIRVYQVLTSIGGTSSQTLPCSTSDIVHEINEQLGEQTLVMKGKDLLWNGSGVEHPKQPLIQYMNWLHMGLPRKDPAGTVEAREEAEYFELEGETWYFRKATTKPGMHIEFNMKPEPSHEDVFDSDFNFEFIYVASREPLKDVRTLDVGKPRLETIASRGKWLFRLGEWSCLRLSVPSKGRLYVFVRVALVDPDKPMLP